MVAILLQGLGLTVSLPGWLSPGGVGGCLGNLPVTVLIGRLMTLKNISTERGILFYA